MKEFRIYQIRYDSWNIEVSGGFHFNNLQTDTMNEISDFLLNLGFEEINEEIDDE
mgnify:CR=1 FL=1